MVKTIWIDLWILPRSEPCAHYQRSTAEKQIMVKDFFKFADTKNFGNVEHKIMDLKMAIVNGDRWKRIRTLVSPTFTSGKMRKMFPIVNECANVLLNTIDKRLDTNSELDFKSAFGSFATKTNAHENPNHPFIVNAKKIFQVTLQRMLAAFIFSKRLNKALNINSVFIGSVFDYFIELSRHVINDRKIKNVENNKYNDFLQLMINAENIDENYRDEDDKLDAHHVNEGDDEIRAERDVLFTNKTNEFLSEREAYLSFDYSL